MSCRKGSFVLSVYYTSVLSLVLLQACVMMRMQKQQKTKIEKHIWTAMKRHKNAFVFFLMFSLAHKNVCFFLIWGVCLFYTNCACFYYSSSVDNFSLILSLNSLLFFLFIPQSVPRFLLLDCLFFCALFSCELKFTLTHMTKRMVIRMLIT